MTALEFLQLLDGARKSGEGWMAKCPAHEDRSASLSVGSGSDGRVLICCFAGCTPYEITSAVGVKLADLFPPKIETFRPSGPAPKHNPADLLKVVAHESLIVLAAAGTLANGHGLSATDYARLELAEERIARVREACR